MLEIVKIPKQKNHPLSQTESSISRRCFHYSFINWQLFLWGLFVEEPHAICTFPCSIQFITINDIVTNISLEFIENVLVWLVSSFNFIISTRTLFHLSKTDSLVYPHFRSIPIFSFTPNRSGISEACFSKYSGCLPN